MALCDVHFFGESIQKHSGMRVVLPDGDGPFPVLYLLHGLSDDHTVWLRRTSLERALAEVPLIVVTPDGHRSFYCNDPRPGGCAYESHIVSDVVGFADRTFPTIPQRGARAVAGLSMGGYGAVMLALRHPEMFAAAAAHSSAFHFAHRPIEGRQEVNTYAAALPKGQYDVFALAEGLSAAGRPPAIRFDCGTDDGLLGASRDFHAHLEALGVAHEYAEHPGGHDWSYWDEHVRETIEFVMQHLRA